MSSYKYAFLSVLLLFLLIKISTSSMKANSKEIPFYHSARKYSLDALLIPKTFNFHANNIYKHNNYPCSPYSADSKSPGDNEKESKAKFIRNNILNSTEILFFLTAKHFNKSHRNITFGTSLRI